MSACTYVMIRAGSTTSLAWDGGSARNALIPKWLNGSDCKSDVHQFESD